jgi:hypothetical protein
VNLAFSVFSLVSGCFGWFRWQMVSRKTDDSGPQGFTAFDLTKASHGGIDSRSHELLSPNHIYATISLQFAALVLQCTHSVAISVEQ